MHLIRGWNANYKSNSITKQDKKNQRATATNTQNNPITTWTKVSNKNFFKEDIQMSGVCYDKVYGISRSTVIVREIHIKSKWTTTPPLLVQLWRKDDGFMRMQKRNKLVSFGWEWELLRPLWKTTFARSTNYKIGRLCDTQILPLCIDQREGNQEIGEMPMFCTYSQYPRYINNRGTCW